MSLRARVSGVSETSSSDAFPLRIAQIAPLYESVLRHTVLPAFLKQVDIRHLEVGAATIDLRFERSDHDVAINVMNKRGKVEVVAIK